MPANLPPSRISSHLCVCGKLSFSPLPLALSLSLFTPSFSLSALSISTLVYVSLQKSAVSLEPFINEIHSGRDNEEIQRHIRLIKALWMCLFEISQICNTDYICYAFKEERILSNVWLHKSNISTHFPLLYTHQLLYYRSRQTRQ